MADEPTDSFNVREALFYHETIRPGKIEIVASKPMATQRDLSLAYSPGVAVPVQAIADDPANAARYTARANLVAVPKDSPIEHRSLNNSKITTHYEFERRYRFVS